MNDTPVQINCPNCNMPMAQGVYHPPIACRKFREGMPLIAIYQHLHSWRKIELHTGRPPE